MYFDVRVLAFDPHSTEDPVDALVRVFRVERAIARELVHRLPRVIKRAVTLETAQKFCDVLERMGARTEIVMSANAPKEPEPVEPVPAAREPMRHPPARSVPGKPGAGRPQQGLPAPSAAMLAPVVSHGPANGNAGGFPASGNRAAARSSQGQPEIFRNSDSSVFFLPEPSTQDAMRILPPRGAAPRPSVREERRGGIEEVRVRHGLPAPREPDPLEADIAGLVDRALVEVPTVPPAPAPPATARRDFRPARPVPEFEPVPSTPLRDAVLHDAYEEPALPEPLLRETARTREVPTARESRPQPARESIPQPAREPAPQPVREAAPLPARDPPAASVRDAAQAPAAAKPFALPSLALPGSAVDLKELELRGNRSLRRSLTLLSALMFAALTLATLGVALLVALGAWLADGTRRWLRVRAMQGSAVPVGQAQLPELYAWVKQLGLRLDLARLPRLYVGRGAGADLVAVPFHGELHVLVDGDAFAAHVRAETHHVMSFLLAHELASYALGQRRRVRALLAALWPSLGRSEALAADVVAAELMGDRSLAQRALATLLAGSAMAELLDSTELDRQGASHERGSWVYAPALDAGTGFLLSRLHHMQQGHPTHSRPP
jgi:hypothetical protein